MTSVRDNPTTGPNGGNPMPCDEIQAHLFDYFTHEAGEGRTDLIREHLRNCPACQARATEIQHAVGMLHDGSRDDLPQRLSDKHRARLDWAFAHPVLDWIYYHHIIVSVIIAVVVILTTFGLLRHYKVLREREPANGITVVIGEPTPEKDDE